MATLIERKFGICLGLTAVGALLANLGLTPQKPLQRAYRRDPQAIEAWQRKVFPGIASQAKTQGGEVYLWDESGCRADGVHSKTWGVKGQTPVIDRPGQRQSISTGLQAEHVRFTASGVELRTEDADGASRLAMAAPRKPDHATCPVRALENWLRTSDTAFGPVFRKLDRWGNLEHHRLGADAVRRILIQRALRRPRHAAPGEAA